MTTATPIFVVGPSRSGTALTRALLNAHPHVHLAGETHYYDDLRTRFRGRESERLINEAERRACEDYFLALTHRPYGHAGVADQGSMARDDLRAEAERLGGSPDAYFEAYCRLRASGHGASRWGEKTPRHVFRIPEILECFRDAQVVCLVRDPRAVVASYRDWRNQGGFDLDADPDHASILEEEQERTSGSYHPIILSLLWNGQVNAMIEARECFGTERVRIQRYEDLVAGNEASVRGLSSWLDLEYDTAMLDVPMQNSSFSRFDRGSGISTDAVDRWRSRLNDTELAIIQTTCRSLMRTFDYEAKRVKPSPVGLLGCLAKFPVVGIRALQLNRDRAGGSLPAYIMRRARLITGFGRNRRPIA